MTNAETFQLVALTPLFVGSAALWIALFPRLTRGEDVLPYEPRLRTPWHAPAGLVIVVLQMLNVAVMLSLQPLADQPVATTSEDSFVENALTACLMYACMIAVIATMVVQTVGATTADFGLPKNWGQFRGDVRLGLLAALATIAPTYGLSYLIATFVPNQSAHPTLERLASEGGLATLAATALLAAVVAPIFEEFGFRLLFQGWLEKIEDQRLRWQATARWVVDEQEEAPSSPDDDQPQESDNPFESPRTVSIALKVRETPTEVDQEARRELVSIGRLGHGWAPILASSFMFGLAHYGIGFSPIPLFLFALVLGYVYQRTHRILPTVVAHMAFNGTSIVLMWIGARIGE